MVSFVFTHAAVKDEGQRAGEEEESIIKGLLPCVAGVGGVAIALWVVVYLYAYVPPHSKCNST